MVASITTWFRLEPLDQSSDLEASLTAPIADPLWLLHRQWQIGELHANDAGSPIAVTVDYQQTRLSRFRAGPANVGTEAGTVVDYDPQQLPLEVVVEAEPTRGLPDQHRRLAAEAGLAFLRLLSGGLGQLHQAYRDLFPLRAERSPRPEADPIGAEAAILLNRRAIDGDRLADRLRRFRDSHGGELTSLPADFPQGSHPADVLAAAVTWLAWYDALIVEPPSGTPPATSTPPAWQPRRFEYQFATGCRLGTASATFGATAFDDGYLDWPDLSVSADELDPPEASPVAAVHVSIPVPLAYAGMPAHRHWEIEDSRVNFASIQAGSTDIVRMLLTDFALVYGDDWFLAPLPVSVGCLVDITGISVRDTFGLLSTVPPTEPLEAGDRRWAMFRQSAVAGAADVPPSTLLVPPTLVGTMKGPPLEEVAFFRDEMANVVWAVERSTASPLGTTIDRYRFSQPAERVAVDVTDIGNAELVYRMTTPIPTNWYPYLPKRAPGDADIHLERLPTSDPFGVVAAESSFVEDEEVSRGGLVVERSWKYARWTNGQALLWLGRQVQAGRGEGSSGLAWDTAGEGPRT
jgi:hypothetical protein